MMILTYNEARRRMGRGALHCPLSGRKYPGAVKAPPVVTQLNPHALRRIRGGDRRRAQP